MHDVLRILQPLGDVNAVRQHIIEGMFRALAGLVDVSDQSGLRR